MSTPGVLNLGEITTPLLIFGGAYGNLQATQALFKQARALAIPNPNIICNGDLVAYCAQPAETVELIRSSEIRVLQGNCEESLAHDSDDCGCGFETESACALLAEAWYPYSSQHLSSETKRWMGALPAHINFTMAGRSFYLVHGGLSAINRFVYASTPAVEKQQELALCDADVVIGGHAGIPFGEVLHGRYWLNSGVIGMPANDGTRDGWYLLLLPQAKGVRCEWRRLSYDTEAAHAAMQQSGRSDGYATALITGLWPSMDSLPETEKALQGRALSLSPLIIRHLS
ncbi:MAG: diadenosine tetraphosphatase [gamma proteobacterium symbiont of Ctena orbiculata]|nr:MAG: diadenosine tetraphosphatase [gamma proteobacterium symbiont of Ctena orbiculata]PVV17499.1 MAG: diadenosine tetraphosphatase [gamma proteobacterium symbiont of Ctena orbiculata]